MEQLCSIPSSCNSEILISRSRPNLIAGLLWQEKHVHLKKKFKKERKKITTKF